MEVLGRCLGPNLYYGNEICQATLQMNGKLVPCRSLHRLRPNELAPSNESESQKRAAFDAVIQENLGDSMTLPPKLTLEDKPQILDFSPDKDEHQGSDFIPKEDAIDSTGKPVNQKSITDLFINSEVMLSQGEQQHKLSKFI